MDGRECTAWRIGPLLAGARIVLLADFLDPQIRIRTVADVFEDQRLGAVADDDPVTRIDFEPAHECLLARLLKLVRTDEAIARRERD